ncbi:MAG: M56 family metallopeptidase [Acidobacteriota bacterium]|nr:M56 family metallopeptidase [Acidobacteriota bacterium]
MSVAPLSTVLTMAVSDVVAGFERLAHVAAPIAVTALWQGLAVTVALAGALKLVPRISAGQRFAAWAIGFGVVAVLPLAPLFGHFSKVQASVAATPSAAHQAWLKLVPAWGVAIALLWAAASLLRAVDLGVHAVGLRRIWKSARPVDLAFMSDRLREGARIPRQVQVCSTTELDRPSVIGFLAPRILIPAWLLKKLTQSELEQVVLHEAEHLRRRDDWTNLLQKIALVLFPLNPALWWMEQRLCREREMACDEGVVRQTRAPRAYAACLASLAERGLAQQTEALTLGSWQRRPELVDRVHRILRRSHEMSPLATGAFLAATVCGLIAGSVELVRCPQVVAFDSVLPVAHTAIRTAMVRPELASSPATSGAHAEALEREPATKGRARSVAIMAVMHEPESSERGAQLAGRAQGPRAVAVRAEMPQTAAAMQASGAGSQFFVLTAWEQVEIVEPVVQVSADYDIVAHPDSPIPVPAIERFTVTRLILRVVPKSSAPAAPLFARDGWLTLQL